MTDDRSVLHGKNAIKKSATWARRELIDRVRQQTYRYGAENEKADMNANAAHGVVFTPVQRSQRQALIERIEELTRRVNGASGSERVRLQKQLNKV